MTYSYSQYWKHSGKSYAKKFKHTPAFETQERQLIEQLKQLDFESVFELGCGFGRITKLITDNFNVTKYDAIDISKHQIKNANVKGVNFEVADFNEYTPHDKYDLVIASEILMHIPTNLINRFVHKWLGMTTKFAINIDAYGHYDRLADHNFIHPYLDLFTEFETKPIDLKNGQFMFVVSK